ncbi:MAG: flagellin, partial [Paracoccaceae bacterium]
LIFINGTSIAAGASIGALVTNINASAGPVGVTATRKGDNILITGEHQEVTFRNTAAGGVTTSTAKYFGATIAGHTGTDAVTLEVTGRIRLDSTSNQPISIALGDDHTVAEHGLLQNNVGAADFEVNATSLGVSAGSSVSGLSVATSESASKAISTLDNAINTVDQIRGELGALNNRLDYTVTNLSNIVLNTQAARSQIEDANFASETTNMIKNQILSQAATSMLAQANQSQQGLLALLQ